uniref:Uncharacterized protein n=1 Tax=Agrobacterium tumefaciens TaxID=358 RepID=Q9WWE8_AGRTU|nr:hypothetical protein [Agrobacterium tumefaciens]
MIDGFHRCGNFGRSLTILARLRCENILKGDANTVRFGMLAQFEQRFALTLVSAGALSDLIGAQKARVLDENAGVDAVANLDQCLCSIDLVPARCRVHEVRGHEAVHGIAEGKRLKKGSEPIATLFDDAATCDQIEAGKGEFDRVDADCLKAAQLSLEAVKLAVRRCRIEARCDNIVHNDFQF